jgi:hypothetical protein
MWRGLYLAVLYNNHINKQFITWYFFFSQNQQKNLSCFEFLFHKGAGHTFKVHILIEMEKLYQRSKQSKSCDPRNISTAEVRTWEKGMSRLTLNCEDKLHNCYFY